MSDTLNRSGGIGVTGALLIVFVTLKLCGKIDWSWWWVLSPMWIPVAIITAFLLVVVAALAVGAVVKMVTE